MSRRTLAFTLSALLGACSTAGDVPAPQASPPMELGTTRRFDFEGEAAGQPPSGWKVEGTRSGLGGGGAGLAEWAVVSDATAPSGHEVLAVTASAHGEQDTFNLCWTDKVSFRDGRLSVKVKPVSGNVDQGGGLVWRVKGHDDYMLCRFNPLEQNVRVYRVVGGVRTQLDSALIDVDGGTWHTLEVVQAGDHVTCSLDGRALLEARDDHLPGAGGVGLWTKADALSAFDDLSVASAAP